MKNMNKKSINYMLPALAILALVVILLPINTYAEGGRNTTFSTYSGTVGSGLGGNFGNDQRINPRPRVSSISPDRGTVGTGARTVTITGSGFTPSSVARVDGSNRATTFIDPSHLYVRVTDSDMFKNDGFFVTVHNPAPGGGNSNSDYFTIEKRVISNTGGNVNSNVSNNPGQFNQNYNDAYWYDDNNNNLAAGAIYGTDGFMPNTIVEWILFAILLLLIVILVRKIFAAQRYYATPLKID